MRPNATPDEQYGVYRRYNNLDGTTSVYRDDKFLAALENDTATCRLFYVMANEIATFSSENARLRKALEFIAKVSEDKLKEEVKNLSLITNKGGGETVYPATDLQKKAFEAGVRWAEQQAREALKGGE